MILFPVIKTFTEVEKKVLREILREEIRIYGENKFNEFLEFIERHKLSLRMDSLLRESLQSVLSRLFNSFFIAYSEFKGRKIEIKRRDKISLIKFGEVSILFYNLGSLHFEHMFELYEIKFIKRENGDISLLISIVKEKKDYFREDFLDYLFTNFEVVYI